MSTSQHPTSAELLLWQSGELSPERIQELRRHLAGCAECTDKIETLESLYGEIASTRRDAAGHRFHQAFLERQQPFWKKLHVIPRWTAVTASTVIAAILLITFADYTPSARAEVLLSRAVQQEAVRPAPSHLLNIKSSGMNCNVVVRHDVGVVLVTDSDRDLCGLVSSNLHDAGWNWNDLLSARSFKQWRDGLNEKKDAITRMSNATEVTTTTNEGAMQSATLRLRSTDYRPMQARFVFASRVGGNLSEFEVTESDEVPEEIAKNATMTHPETPRSVPPSSSLPLVDPMDTVEADVRLTIHHLGADKNVLLLVNHMPDAIRVTGIAPPSMAASITSSLAGFPHVETRIGSEDSTPSSTGWRSFRGNAPPLAYEEVNALYSSDTEARQNFVNEVDAITLRLAGEARTKDGLVPLANRLEHTSHGLRLQSTTAEVQAKMSADLSALAVLLKPIIGPSSLHAGRLSYAQATQLYTLVHELVSANRSDNTLTRDETADRIKRLISGK